MHILILGYGKMGKTIESILSSKGHTSDHADTIEERSRFGNKNFDVIIDFSIPDAALDNIFFAFQKKTPIVCGTTGWLNRFEEAKKRCEEEGGTLFYSPNYSIGVNLFFQLNKKFASVMNKFVDYDVSMNEIHHTQKLDAPSGTAIRLAEIVTEQLDHKTGWSFEKPAKDKLQITSERIGEVPGTHTITYTSPIDSISLTHEAHSRAGFAMGAVLVAEWVWDKKGVLGMDEFLGDLML